MRFLLVTILIIAVNVLILLIELAGGEAFINHWSLVSADIMAGRGWITVLTSMFMHGGWMHILGNMLFFWVFGPEIEDVMGSVRYLLFYLLGGLVATLAQVVVAPTSTVPNLGASGAIAAVMGALRPHPHRGAAGILRPDHVHSGYLPGGIVVSQTAPERGRGAGGEADQWHLDARLPHHCSGGTGMGTTGQHRCAAGGL
jgi:membrane associated rhomboid family serine protease